MRPTVPELLRGVADALETDAVAAIDDPHARHQVVAAVGVLRRIATLVPHLHATMLADIDDIVATLAALEDHLRPEHGARLAATTADATAIDVRRATLDALDAVHQSVLALLDDVVADPGGDPTLDAALHALAARVLDRERAIGASIAAR